MRSTFLIFTLISVIFAGPVVQEMLTPQVLATTTYAYALDLSAQLTLSGAQCIKSNKYSTVFIRGYAATGNGVLDSYACSNINNAYNAGLGTEVYMTPLITSSKNGTQQFDELYNGLKKCNIVIRSVWIQYRSRHPSTGAILEQISTSSIALSVEQ
ncbi:hypothetical protein NECAME_18008, partial [Necator americanus]